MAKFKKGDPKPSNSGRKKGVGNKKITPNLMMQQAYEALQQGLNQAGFDLLKEMNNLYTSTQDDKIKLQILQMLLDRSIPVLKAADYKDFAPAPQEELDSRALDLEDEATLIAKLNEQE